MSVVLHNKCGATVEVPIQEFNSEESHFLIKNLGETKWTSLLEYYKTGRPSKKQKESAAALKPVCSEPITEKADRTAFHKAVRAVFGEELATETLDKVDGDKQHQVIQIVWADGRTKSSSSIFLRIQ